MAGYQLEGPKAARMYEVILPKKLGYFGKVQEVLEDLFDEDAIRAVPFIQRSIADRRRRDASFDEDAWVKTLCRASGGYSIYEMDGRYVAPAGGRSTSGSWSSGSSSTTPASDADPKTDFLAASLEVVNHLVAHRFAEELGVEEEIWFLEYPDTRLAIWRKDDEPAPPPETIDCERDHDPRRP